MDTNPHIHWMPPGPHGYPQQPQGTAQPSPPLQAQPQPQRTARALTARQRVVAAGAMMMLALGAGGAGAAGAVALLGDRGAVPASPAAPAAHGSTIAQIAAAVQPSVVSVQAATSRGTSGGSGVILRADGTILTNAHVVAGAAKVQVKLSDGRTFPARVLGADAAKDIAVLKAQGAAGLKPATLGDSGALAVGDPVVAIGSPLGLAGSVTSGIVSALNRKVTEGGGPQEQQLPPGFGQAAQEPTATIDNAIQTDAAINPGNSGGALVNGAGQVIGVNSAIATTSAGSGNIGVGFAIPINTARQVAQQIIDSA
jgi:putative serine protease PepD